MSKEIKEKIRPIYEQLKGYLEQFPPLDKQYSVYNSSFWNAIDDCIQELNTITENNYDKFKITVLPPEDHYDSQHIDNSEYRSKVNGLIMNLKGSYFQDDNPFVGNPMISVSQIQNVQVTMLLEINTLIDKQLFGQDAKHLKPEEKSFLEKIKLQLPTIQSAVQLIALVIKTAKDCGVDVHTIGKLFSLS